MASKRVEDEYKKFSDGNLWQLMYQRIGLLCQRYPYTCIEAKQNGNKSMNRYRDVNPFDHSRVRLERSGLASDYINANIVKVESANRQYILTQGPLMYTSSHFWLMVWEQKSAAIIMLNKVVEKKEIKCHWYWPHEHGDAHKVQYLDVNITVQQIQEDDFNYYTIRHFKVTNEDTQESRIILHFHYTTWPDFEVPQSPTQFLNFLQKVRDAGVLEGERAGKPLGPAVVHCSAGIGRSGTFCLVDSVLVLIEKEGQANVDVQEILLEMRRYRMGLIQTSEQLRFSYQAIVEGINRLKPDYVPAPDDMDESIYDAAANDEDEAPPPLPPRAESLARPPVRPLPAIPSSASMGNMDLPGSEEEYSSPTPLQLDVHVLSSEEEYSSPTPLQLDVHVLSSEEEYSSPTPLQLDVHVLSSEEEYSSPTPLQLDVHVLSSEEEYSSPTPLQLDLDLPGSEEEDSSPMPPQLDLSWSPSPVSHRESDTDPLLEDADNADIVIASSLDTEGTRRRRKEQLAARVADMKRRLQDADRHHSLKRSLAKSLVLSIGFLATAAILIYVYAKQ